MLRAAHFDRDLSKNAAARLPIDGISSPAEVPFKGDANEPGGRVLIALEGEVGGFTARSLAPSPPLFHSLCFKGSAVSFFSPLINPIFPFSARAKKKKNS